MILNDILVSEEIKNAMFSMDANVAEACDLKAKEICSELFPSIDFALQENIDLVIRPLSAVIALNEMLLQDIFSSASIDGILNSSTLAPLIKAKMLKNFGRLNGIPVISNDPESIYSEIKFFLKNNNINNESILESSILNELTSVDRLFFADSSCVELSRNKISYIQLNHQKIMDFSRSEANRGTLIDGAYNRSDFQIYQEYKKADKVTLSGLLDVYFSSAIIEETATIDLVDGKYSFDAGYYIDIKTDGNFTIIEDDNMSYGITKFAPSVFVQDATTPLQFIIKKYKDPLFENYSRKNDFVVTDTMFKGFFPIFVDFNIYSKAQLDPVMLKTHISEYLLISGGSFDVVSIFELTSYLLKQGITCTIGAKGTGNLFISTGTKLQMDIVFPLSMKDIVIPPEIANTHFSKRTIKIFAGDINVEQE